MVRASGYVVHKPMASEDAYEFDMVENIRIKVNGELHNRLTEHVMEKLLHTALAAIQWRPSEESAPVFDVSFEGLECIKFPLKDMLDNLPEDFEDEHERNVIADMLEAAARSLRNE